MSGPEQSNTPTTFEDVATHMENVGIMVIDTTIEHWPASESYARNLTMGDLAQAVIDFKDLQKELTDKIDKAKEAYQILEAEILRRYFEEGQLSGAYSDRKTGRRKTLYVKEDLNPIARFSYTDYELGEKFMDFLSEISLDHLKNRSVGETFAKFRNAVKEEVKMRQESGEASELPERWKDFVEVRREHKINMRTGG